MPPGRALERLCLFAYVAYGTTVVVADEDIVHLALEEIPVKGLAVAYPLANRLHQLPMSVLPQQHVLVGPSLAEHDGFAPRRRGDEVGKFHTFPTMNLRLRRQHRLQTRIEIAD